MPCPFVPPKSVESNRQEKHSTCPHFSGDKLLRVRFQWLQNADYTLSLLIIRTRSPFPHHSPVQKKAKHKLIETFGHALSIVWSGRDAWLQLTQDDKYRLRKQVWSERDIRGFHTGQWFSIYKSYLLISFYTIFLFHSHLEIDCLTDNF